MADSDPISEYSPSAKKRKLINGSVNKTWDPDNDSGDDLFNDHETIATQPLKRPFRSSQHSQNAPFSSNRDLSYVTQPTQPKTQYTYNTQAPTQDVQVQRSSPPVTVSPPQHMPPPITRAPFSKPQSLLASVASIAPRGTALRRPAPAKKEVIDVDSDMSDPPVEHSSDEESRSLASNIRPTQFVKGGRGMDSSPNQIVRDSPRAVEPPPSMFSSLVNQFKHNQADDMASAYGGISRAPRRDPIYAASSAASLTGSPFKTLEDVDDFRIRGKISRIQNILGPEHSIARIYDALRRKHMHEEDALEYLVNEGAKDHDLIDDLAYTPYKQAQRAKGLAQAVPAQTSQTAKSSAKQNITAPVQSIAQRYGDRGQGSTNIAIREGDKLYRPPMGIIGQSEDVVRPKGRLLKGRRPRTPSPEVQSAGRRAGRKNVIAIDDDSDEEAVMSAPEEVEVTGPTTFDQRVLKFFNTCSNQELLDLSAQSEEDVQFVVDKRPFRSLTQIRSVARENPDAKKKSRTKPIGEKMVDTCEEMLSGYEAVDQLVDKCEKLARPIQEALKAWGPGIQSDGELQLMKIDEIHDSGVGTPSSTYSDHKRSKAGKPNFLAQPSNMSTEITMKDYQLVGLNWLYLLYGARTSCILADDMGLGKTCQVISFLAQLQLEEVDGVHLVIVPGSTLENWLRELQRFAPSLNVFAYYGLQAERPGLQQQLEDNFGEYDVVVTTYDMAVKDNKFLRRLEPAVCVYDEAHQLRNPKSDRYEKLMRIPADFKVLLTGTPLQNNLQELIAILAFIMPDMFLEKREELEFIFKHKASTKNANHNALLSAQRTQRARSMITPFILRRKKAQVLDLPAKHSRVEYCSLSDTQAEMYDEVQNEVKRIFQARANGGKKTAPKASANILMDLRKAAIHPLLKREFYNDKKIDKITTLLLKHDEFAGNPRDKVIMYLTGDAAQSLNGNDFSIHQFCAERNYLQKYALQHEEWMDSGKVQKFKEIIQGYAKSGDKALVFSQFTMVMDILEAVLQTLDIKYMRLDGSTPMDVRQTMIDKYNDDKEITVFMLSTKAGGAGINLASANKVVIFDSGFNPQDDIQAENRAHRVGQTREVEVIRLVSKDTIEEQIHALGASKLALDERVAGEGTTAAEDKVAEKAGVEAVERMLMDNIQKGGSIDREGGSVDREGGSVDREGGSVDREGVDDHQDVEDGEDVKDTFKKGLQDNGLRVD